MMRCVGCGGAPLSIGEAYPDAAAMLDDRMVIYGDQVKHYHATLVADGERRLPRREAGRWHTVTKPVPRLKWAKRPT
jgi:hypothetical protein